MSRLTGRAQAAVASRFVRSALYEGTSGKVWFAGSEQRAPSIASFFCGDDAHLANRGRLWRRNIPDRITEVASAGGLPIVQVHKRDSGLDDIMSLAIEVPLLVDIHSDLPDDVEALRASLRTSTTREDLRRIRRAGFSYRITSDPGAVREFHARHYGPLVADRFPEDGTVAPVESMLRNLDRGGELICADVDGTWVAGMFNVRQEANYALRSLGIRDADMAVRQKRVASALIVRSLERAVELGQAQASLGRALPFLGKGPIWFKAKWGGIVTLGPPLTYLYIFMDLRHAAVRGMLSATPIIHVVSGSLAATTWMEPGEEALRTTLREAGRYPGISHWYVLGRPETLAVGAEQFAASGQIVPIPVDSDTQRPVWLGEALPSPGAG